MPQGSVASSSIFCHISISSIEIINATFTNINTPLDNSISSIEYQMLMSPSFKRWSVSLCWWQIALPLFVQGHRERQPASRKICFLCRWGFRAGSLSPKYSSGWSGPVACKKRRFLGTVLRFLGTFFFNSDKKKHCLVEWWAFSTLATLTWKNINIWQKF